MPIDASIPLQVQSPPLANLMQQQQQAQSLRLSQSLMQERQEKVAADQRLVQQNQVLDHLMQHSFTDDPDTGVSTFNRDQFQQGLVQGGLGHLYPQMAGILDKLDESSMKMATERRKMVAQSIYGVQQAGNTPEAMLSAIAYLKKNNAITDAHAQPILQGMAQDNSSDNIGKMLGGIANGLPEYRDLMNAEEARKTGLAKTQADTEKLLADAALSRSKAGPPDVPTLTKTLDAIIPPSDTANAALRAATVARINNARTHEEGMKALEDAQNQIGQVNVARQKAPITVGVNVASQAGKNKLGELSDAAVEQQAIAYLTSGQMPAMGMGAPQIRAQILNKAAELNPSKAIALQKATYAADSANLMNLQKTEGTLSAFESGAGKNIDQFLSLISKLPDSGVPWLNTPIRNLSDQVVGNEWLPAIQAARKIALREVGRVTNDPKLSGALTDTARSDVYDMVSGNATIAQMLRTFPVLRKDMANVHAGLIDEIRTVKERLGSNPTTTATGPAMLQVPANVAAALKGAPAGKHTLSDGSVWLVDSSGNISK